MIKCIQKSIFVAEIALVLGIAVLIGRSFFLADVWRRESSIHEQSLIGIDTFSIITSSAGVSFGSIRSRFTSGYLRAHAVIVQPDGVTWHHATHAPAPYPFADHPTSSVEFRPLGIQWARAGEALPDGSVSDHRYSNTITWFVIPLWFPLIIIIFLIGSKLMRRVRTENSAHGPTGGGRA
jgi:hypothetical protein